MDGIYQVSVSANRELYVKMMKEDRPKYEEFYRNFGIHFKAGVCDEYGRYKDFLKELEPRVLATVYQRYYVSECLMYTDSELRQFYDANREMFAADTGDFLMIRGKVAQLYEISKRKDEYLKFVSENSDPKRDADSLILLQSFIGKHLYPNSI